MSVPTGISHVMLTVNDLPAAQRFWVDVMGLEVAVAHEAMLICVASDARLAIGCLRHDEAASEPFDERQVGLDHLALDVPDVPALHALELRFAQHAVPFTPVVESEWGWHLNARAPENLAVEFHVSRPELLEALYGGSGAVRERLGRLLGAGS